MVSNNTLCTVCAGDWSFQPRVREEEEEGERGRESLGSFFTIDDEDADVDESSDSEGSSDAEADASLKQVRLTEIAVFYSLVF